MMKKFLLVFLSLSLSASMLTACSSSSQQAAPSASIETQENVSSNTSSGKLRVGVVVNQKFGDNGPMDDLAKGAKRGEQDFGVEIKLMESANAANFEEDIRAMARDGYDLLVTTFPYMTDATKVVAQEYPNTDFSAIFQFINMGDASIPNIWDTEFHGEAAFYLAGYLCGKTTQSNKIGLIIGGEEPTPNAEGNGFMNGVKDANPNASVEFAFVGSYEDPAKAKEIANAMVDKGCDIIQTNSGASNAGVIEAAKDAKILCAGEISDFYDSYDGFIGIIGIGFGDTLYAAVEQKLKDEYPGGGHGIRDLSNGGYFVDWASYERFAAANETFGANLSAAIAEAKEMEKNIIAGQKTIEFDTEVPNWERIAEK